MTLRPLAIAVLAGVLSAQVPITFQYFYDDTGQLIKVVDSTGIVIEYVYDAVGNMLEIKRTAVATGGLAIFSFAPSSAGPLSRITIRGQGFSPTPALNIVRIGGIAATVVLATPTELVVEIPVNAASGAISVTVGAATASSASPISVAPIPVVSSVSPNTGVAGGTVTGVQAGGANLSGAAWRFEPALVPAAIAISSVSVNAAGTVATMSLSIAASARGSYALIATNAAGSSNSFLSPTNEFRVGALTSTESSLASILNRVSPAPSIPAPREAGSLVLAILNRVSPAAPGPVIREAASALLAILNGVSPATPGPVSREAASALVAILNAISPAPSTPTSREAGSAVFSILNGVVTSMLSNFERQAGDPTMDIRSYGPDSDGDGIPDTLEALIFTDPRKMDTDGDGYPDGLEVVLGSDPLDPASLPRIDWPRDFQGPVFSMQAITNSNSSVREEAK